MTHEAAVEKSKSKTTSFIEMRRGYIMLSHPAEVYDVALLQCPVNHGRVTEPQRECRNLGIILVLRQCKVGSLARRRRPNNSSQFSSHCSPQKKDPRQTEEETDFALGLGTVEGEGKQSRPENRKNTAGERGREVVICSDAA